MCGECFDIDEMEADPIPPWSEGGKINTDNLQMLCRDGNRRKSNIWFFCPNPETWRAPVVYDRASPFQKGGAKSSDRLH
ncbi:MAG: HNH endonuclease signature motif containing protein [Saccharofermentanales bacterium]